MRTYTIPTVLVMKMAEAKAASCVGTASKDRMPRIQSRVRRRRTYRERHGWQCHTVFSHKIKTRRRVSYSSRISKMKTDRHEDKEEKALTLQQDKRCRCRDHRSFQRTSQSSMTMLLGALKKNTCLRNLHLELPVECNEVLSRATIWNGLSLLLGQRTCPRTCPSSSAGLKDTTTSMLWLTRRRAKLMCKLLLFHVKARAQTLHKGSRPVSCR